MKASRNKSTEASPHLPYVNKSAPAVCKFAPVATATTQAQRTHKAASLSSPNEHTYHTLAPVGEMNKDKIQKSIAKL